jgi:hypothetical protein
MLGERERARRCEADRARLGMQGRARHAGRVVRSVVLARRQADTARHAEDEAGR